MAVLCRSVSQSVVLTAPSYHRVTFRGIPPVQAQPKDAWASPCCQRPVPWEALIAGAVGRSVGLDDLARQGDRGRQWAGVTIVSLAGTPRGFVMRHGPDLSRRPHAWHLGREPVRGSWRMA
jgi:hypothetical protein